MRYGTPSTIAKIFTAVAITLAFATSSWAQATETILYNFNVADGAAPYAGVIFDSKGNLYGTTQGGGTDSSGTVYELTPNANGTWTQQVLYNFTGFGGTTDGAILYSGLAFDGKGNLYGTTLSGGTSFDGTVWELSPGSNGTWTETVLYSFTGGTDGGQPYAGLAVDTLGNLYGTTYAGGRQGFGTVFELVAGSNGTWTEKVLHSFTGGSDGGYPGYGALVFDSAGNLYGSASNGGAHDYGLIFELSPGSNGAWTEKVVHSFTGGAGGISSLGSVAFDGAGNLYSEALYSVMELTPQSNGWTVKNIHNFVGGSDGASAEGGLIVDKNGNVYGMTYTGGLHMGTVFELSPGSNGTWTENILHKFTGGSDGRFPLWATLAVDSSGDVYGTTPSGGTSNLGMVFELKP